MGGNTQKGKYVEGDMFQNSVVIKNTTYDELMKCLMAGDIQGAMKVMEMQEKAPVSYTHLTLPTKRIV